MRKAQVFAQAPGSKALHVALAESKQDRQRKARQISSENAPAHQVIQRSPLTWPCPQLLARACQPAMHQKAILVDSQLPKGG